MSVKLAARPTHLRAASPRKRAPPHVHFGAGNVGLGLLVPALARRRRPFTVVQRRSPFWDPVRDGDRIGVAINGEDATGGIVVAEAASGVRQDGASMLLTGSQVAWLDVASSARTMSCSLGTACDDILLPVLSALPVRSNPPTLFTFENNRASITNLKVSLAGRVDVVPCTVDRICYDKSLRDGVVRVGAERHGGSVVAFDKRPPIDLDGLRVTSDPSVAAYLYAEKQVFVNSVHTLVAMATVAATGRADAPVDVSAISPCDLEHWKVACVIAVLHDWGTCVPCNALDCSAAELPAVLLSRVDAAARRIASVGSSDRTGRILRRGVDECYTSRMRPVMNSANAAVMTWEQSRVFSLRDTSHARMCEALERVKRVRCAVQPR